MIVIGKKEVFSNGMYFYTKHHGRTIFKIILNDKRKSCWMLSDEDYECIKMGKKEGEIALSCFPEWIFNDAHCGTMDYCKLSIRSYNPILHIDGTESKINGVLSMKDCNGEESMMEIYDSAMKKYLMGFYRYMPIITLD